ncbi:peroxisomal targeting signal 2 receptor isoform X2 [Contarinia nasturtii]|uniref:peroxisomal targeting signal 2 receptor isoform X2 n=1 Tax=Contarinia nasturtii TaxID=265458 RepID=UPI0012D4A97F|nr:peroxisomal targeting signal 2 receptor isoform X2 [Contarinia nasturtii]
MYMFQLGKIYTLQIFIVYMDKYVFEFTEKSTFFMQNRHGYNIQFSPSNADIFAVATCQFFGREGGGTLFLLQLNQKGTIDEIEKIDWTDGLFDIAWAKHNPNILISACGDGTVQLWDVDSKSMSLVSGYSKPKSCYSEHGSEVCCVDWSSQDSLFLSGSWDCSIKLWNPNYKMSLKTYNGHRKLVYESKFGKKNSNIFMSASADGYLKIWDILQPYPISTILAHNNSEVLCCDWNEFDQNIVATGGSDNNIRLWDLRFVASPVIELHGCEYAIRRVRFSPFNSSVLASVSYDHTSRIWNWQYDDEAMEIITHHKESNYGLDWNRLVPNQLGDCGWDSVVNVYTPASLT